MSAAQKTSEAGFSLIEMLAALAVLAVAGVALMNALGTTARTAGLARDAALADMAARSVLASRIAEAGGGALSDRTGVFEMAGVSYDWRLDVGRSGAPGLDRVELVLEEDGEERARLVTFLREARP
ncbi:MAG: type II secretion system minor pseudopilin GspI [Oceanicaulis sp.]